MGYQPSPPSIKFRGYSGVFEGISGYIGYSGVIGFSGYNGCSGISGYSGYLGIWNHFDETFKDFDKVFDDKPTNGSNSITTPTIRLQYKFKMPKIPKKTWLFLIPILMGSVTILLLMILEKIAIK